MSNLYNNIKDFDLTHPIERASAEIELYKAYAEVLMFKARATNGIQSTSSESIKLKLQCSVIEIDCLIEELTDIINSFLAL